MFLHDLMKDLKNKFITLTVLTLIKEEMEEYIQILIFVGAMVIMVVQQNIKAKKKPKTSPFPTGEMLEEVFPELAEAEPVAKPMKKAAYRKKNPSPATSSRPAPIASPPSPKKEKIRLSNREEARRAFIYSEIFNRKY